MFVSVVRQPTERFQEADSIEWGSVNGQAEVKEWIRANFRTIIHYFCQCSIREDGLSEPAGHAWYSHENLFLLWRLSVLDTVFQMHAHIKLKNIERHSSFYFLRHCRAISCDKQFPRLIVWNRSVCLGGRIFGSVFNLLFLIVNKIMAMSLFIHLIHYPIRKAWPQFEG